jgi:hypothetical protein
MSLDWLVLSVATDSCLIRSAKIYGAPVSVKSKDTRIVKTYFDLQKYGVLFKGMFILLVRI